mmetsp:Transcript_22518/g.49205  ORF Transcript_22518/g.49205 Transcript_22518/m.49205 type:complete len:293 (-) Transcript_22518:1524-2402(-)
MLLLLLQHHLHNIPRTNADIHTCPATNHTACTLDAHAMPPYPLGRGSANHHHQALAWGWLVGWYFGGWLVYCWELSSSWSMGMPRYFATSLRVLSCWRAFTVARALFSWLREPMRLASTFCTPANSSTERMAPPAITPVPSEAGTMTQRAAWYLASDLWGMVPAPTRGTLTMFFLASTRVLLTATATSRPAWQPTPTRPFWLPTMATQRKPMILPPFTTLVTRVSSMMRSTHCSPSSSSSKATSSPSSSASSSSSASMSGTSSSSSARASTDSSPRATAAARSCLRWSSDAT